MAFSRSGILAGLLLCAIQLWGQPAADLCNDNTGQYLQMNAPVLEFTVTHFDPTWFEAEDAAKSPTLFTLTISPFLSNTSNTRLRVLIDADTSLGRNSGDRVLVMDRLSVPLNATQIGVPLRSNEVFQMTWEPGGVSFDQSELRDIIAVKRRVPPMDIRFQFALTCPEGGLTDATRATIRVVEYEPFGKFRSVQNLQALSPGTAIANSKPVEIYTLTPLFRIASELFNNRDFIYPENESKFDIFIYELAEGQAPYEALTGGLEFATFGISNEAPAAYPAHLPRLQPGKAYAWRARANLRGPSSDFLLSNTLYFRISERLEGKITPPSSELTEGHIMEFQTKYADDYGKRVMAALKIILGENFEIFDFNRTNQVPARGQIRLNSHPYTLEELENLAKEFHMSRHSITRLRFQ